MKKTHRTRKKRKERGCEGFKECEQGKKEEIKSWTGMKQVEQE